MKFDEIRFPFVEENKFVHKASTSSKISPDLPFRCIKRALLFIKRAPLPKSRPYTPRLRSHLVSVHTSSPVTPRPFTPRPFTPRLFTPARTSLGGVREKTHSVCLSVCSGGSRYDELSALRAVNVQVVDLSDERDHPVDDVLRVARPVHDALEMRSRDDASTHREVEVGRPCLRVRSRHSR